MTHIVIESLFWLSLAVVAYAYVGYPLLLWLLSLVWRREPIASPLRDSATPTATLIVPVHNERRIIASKLANTRMLEYPEGQLEVIFVSDGSTDGTDDVIRASSDGRTHFIVLPERRGKSAALNVALARSRGDIVVFSDASIMLSPNALLEIVRPFQLPSVGCVSGEDHILGAGGEGMYGRYELFLRRQESRLHSIVGASGSFFAMRRSLCEPFVPTLAPDFASVLATVRQGFRAITNAEAVGTMVAVVAVRDEFNRKVRTVLRGITTLGHHLGLLNPVAYGFFAFELFSHKLLRWLVPLFLLCALVTNAILATASPFYLTLLCLQVGFYGLSLVSIVPFRFLSHSLPVAISVYFPPGTMVAFPEMKTMKRFESCHRG
jgi:cellulose synthase/poly-beta-1,6-N-acetylglucosamine synthase-like glycosyltransferase